MVRPLFYTDNFYEHEKRKIPFSITPIVCNSTGCRADRDGETPLFLAVRTQQLENVKRLETTELTETYNQAGETVVHIAAKSGHAAILAELLTQQPNLNLRQRDTGSTALHLAVVARKRECVELLLEAGADTFAKNNRGQSPYVLASGENVNILVLDNQSYSNTGGQTSKATPTGASIKFSEQGKNTRKKNLGLIALNYKDVFVAQIALGKDMGQTIKALKEAQEYDGPSLVIAYCPCVNQGYDLSRSLEEERQAVDCGFWPLYTYNPKTEVLHLQSEMDEEKYQEFLQNERRFTLTKDNQKQYLLDKQQEQAKEEFEVLKRKSENNK